MIIYTETYVPYEYTNKFEVLKHVESRCHGIKKSLRFVEKNEGHLMVRCPLSGDYLDVLGSQEEIDWLDNELRRKNWYRV